MMNDSEETLSEWRAAEEAAKTAFIEAALKLYQAQLDSLSITCDICGSETEFTTDGMQVMIRHLETHD